jgi:hypothetical protein
MVVMKSHGAKPEVDGRGAGPADGAPAIKKERLSSSSSSSLEMPLPPVLNSPTF